MNLLFVFTALQLITNISASLDTVFEQEAWGQLGEYCEYK